MSTTDAQPTGSPMTRTASAGGDSYGLSVMHEGLAAHFYDLRGRRDALGNGAPVFALEHGLSDAEIAALESAVRSAVRHQDFPAEAWLSLVVYAAELGYRYSGDEYWQTFETQTPGWGQSANRQCIRSVFEKFSDSFEGARPSGAWANWFSIISWPITHAVLPTDLQRQFARLLSDCGTALTTDLLADPAALGLKLAARAGHYSKRFQSFAQNTGLLGQVAAALLADDDEESPYLLNSTLRRITRSLSTERQARKWLQDARWSARQVRAHGFQPAEHRPAGPAISRPTGVAGVTGPLLSLRRGPDGWAAWLSLPDLSVLAERQPGVQDELGRLRPLVAGASRAALPRGQLLFPGQPVKLAAWPDAGAPLIQLEGGQLGTNALLAAECALPRGPWVFRLRDRELATEVRGKIVHPEGCYVLLRRDAINPSCLPGWTTSISCRTGGIHAYDVRVPPVIDDGHAAEARFLGIAIQADVSIRPAGVVAADWDGEGTAGWLSGEHVILAVRTTRSTSHCIFEIGRARHALEWPTGMDEIFVTVAGLNTGAHEARVSLVATEGGKPTARGTFVIIVRDPWSRPLGGTLREGLALIASPATPTLPEVWDGRADVQIVGPPGIRARAEIALADHHHRVIASQDFLVKIPLDVQGWRSFAATRLRESPALRHAYDAAESCVITVSDHRLGVAELRCEREFAALRWIVGIHHDDPFAQLIDNTNDSAATLSLFAFSAPDQAALITPAADGRICGRPAACSGHRLEALRQPSSCRRKSVTWPTSNMLAGSAWKPARPTR